ncbi:hypothetical protein [Methanolobus sp. WCC5]|uniref:hypothetical protein n=1 Tax=Methanolobus sp. WCC5 TaxID=3125785 RepID=UPI0032546103
MDFIDAFLIGIALFVVFVLLTAYFLKSAIGMSSDSNMKENPWSEKKDTQGPVLDEKKD